MKIKKLISSLFIIAIILSFAILSFATNYQYKYNPFTTKLDWVVADSELGGGVADFDQIVVLDGDIVTLDGDVVSYTGG